MPRTVSGNPTPCNDITWFPHELFLFLSFDGPYKRYQSQRGTRRGRRPCRGRSSCRDIPCEGNRLNPCRGIFARTGQQNVDISFDLENIQSFEKFTLCFTAEDGGSRSDMLLCWVNFRDENLEGIDSQSTRRLGCLEPLGARKQDLQVMPFDLFRARKI